VRAGTDMCNKKEIWIFICLRGGSRFIDIVGFCVSISSHHANETESRRPHTPSIPFTSY